MVASSIVGTFETWGDRLRRSSETLEGSDVAHVYATRAAYYDVLEAYYLNEVYLRADAENQSIRNWAGLPRAIRPISMLAKRAVDFWATMIYSGAWTPDGLPDRSGRLNRLPYDADTNEKLRLAVQQIWSWSNGPKTLGRVAHMGAVFGELLVEVETKFGEDDSLAASKVYPRPVHPKYVIGLQLSDRGDVLAYRLAIPRVDEAGRSYMWGKEVTKTEVRTFWDDRAHSYDGVPAVQSHGYGFCPACWVTHQTTSGFRGAPAIDGAIPTIDEYQGVLAGIDDYIHKFVNQVVAIVSDNPAAVRRAITGSDGLANKRPGLPTASYEEKIMQQQSVGIIPLPNGASLQQMIQNLGLGEAESHVKRLEEELLNAFPELSLYSKLLEMDQVTKPGAIPLVRQVQSRYDDVCSNYDAQVVKLSQMCVAIGGALIADGEWGLGSQLSAQQKKLRGFDLDSYAAGKLDFSISPRDLIPPTMVDRLTEATMIESLSTPTGLRHAGFSDEEIYGDADGAIPEGVPGILHERSTGMAAADRVSEALTSAFLQGSVNEPVPAPTVPVGIPANGAVPVAPGATSGV